jgi:hypothetical protein
MTMHGSQTSPANAIKIGGHTAMSVREEMVAGREKDAVAMLVYSWTRDLERCFVALALLFIAIAACERGSRLQAGRVFLFLEMVIVEGDEDDRKET